ncbi:hypothetical protein [Mycobacteroides salmoniphilum]|uniref:hypothetical protein n=1 Tax=Mycobacteroides salmoniphilum TaxID=404941 RepID=UPI0012FFC475|nr:hypothetical protein [Mycobacteroides salmoniphilum]
MDIDVVLLDLGETPALPRLQLHTEVFAYLRHAVSVAVTHALHADPSRLIGYPYDPQNRSARRAARRAPHRVRVYPELMPVTAVTGMFVMTHSHRRVPGMGERLTQQPSAVTPRASTSGSVMVCRMPFVRQVIVRSLIAHH